MGKQLSLFNVEKKSDRGGSGYDFDYAMLSPQEAQTNKAPRFISLSILIHGALIVGALSLTPLLKDSRPPETITIEIEDTQAPIISMGASVVATQAAAITQEPATPMPTVTLPPKMESSPVVVPVTKPLAKATASKVAAKTTSTSPTIKPKASSVSVSKTIETPIATTAETINTLDDIDAPELDNMPETSESASSSAVVPVPAVQSVQAAQARLDDIDEGFDNELDTREAEQATALEQQALAQEQELMRQRNASAIAAAKNAEIENARLAKATSAAAAQGAGNNGALTASDTLAGRAQGIRTLDQLKQMPRNPLPQYSADERFSGHQGVVVFQAYITPAGKPTQFKKIRSSGYENLDSKTLAVLKDWKFYPGQEGWVELPFEWSLTGEAQETGRLRRASLDSGD